MRADIRADAVLRELRDDPGERLPAGHRGAGSLRELSDGELLAVVDALVASGKLMRRGHRLRLPEHQPVVLDSEMRERVARLMAGLREAGAEPPRVEGIAARMGIPVAKLRAAVRATPQFDATNPAHHDRERELDALRKLLRVGEACSILDTAANDKGWLYERLTT